MSSSTDPPDPGSIPPTPTPTPTPTPSTPPPQTAQPQRWKRDGVIAVVAATLALGGAWALFGGGDDDPSVEANQPTTVPDGSNDADDNASQGSTTSTVGEPEPGTITPGTHTVGRDIEPGRYIASGYTDFCNWERLSDTAGDQVIARGELVAEQAIVEILPTDVGFYSDGCGTWTLYEPPTNTPVTSFAEGDWIVGDQVEPGTYHADETVPLCMWTRAKGFEHTTQEIIEEPAPGHVPRSVTLAEGERFSSNSCGRWVKVG